MFARMTKPVCFIAILTLSFFCSCSLSPYGEPPDTSDPWVLIKNARNWLQQGRPRAALPSLEKALIVAEKLDHGEAGYMHAKAATHNEFGRAYEMASELDLAEHEFLQAAEIAESLPKYRPLHFDIAFNLSTVFERKAMFAESCIQLRRAAALQADLLTNPASPPEGLGENTVHVLHELAAPRILSRAKRIGCAVDIN